MATHVMTPARRAALRKAQLVSAQKRRKYGVKYQAKNAARQKVAYARVNKRKVAKYAAVGLTGAAIAGGAIAYSKSNRAQVNKSVRRSTRKITSAKLGRGGAIKYHAALAMKPRTVRRAHQVEIKKYQKQIRPLAQHNVTRRRNARKRRR